MTHKNPIPFLGVLLFFIVSLGIILSFFTFTGGSFDLRSKAAVENTNITPWTFVVEPEEIIYGPARFPDASFNTLKVGNTWRGYISRDRTYLMEGADATHMKQVGVTMDASTPGTVDDAGRWLWNTYKVSETKIIGWYHSEHVVSADYHKWEVAYAESNDGGRTWTYPNFPNNRIITTDQQFLGDKTKSDTGAGNVVQMGDYFYVYYLATGPVWHTEVARSSVSDLGKPGTWKKYYCSNPSNKSTCGFTEPGIGGKGTSIPGLPIAGSGIAYNTVLHRFMFPINDHGSFKIYFSEPDDPVTWKESRMLTPYVTFATDDTVNNWIRTGDTKTLRHWFAYPSILSTQDLSEPVGNTFYIYYGKIYPTETHEQIYLTRRKIRMEPKFQWNNEPVVLSFNEYKHTKKGQTRATIEAPKPSDGYTFTKTLGYLLPEPNKQKQTKLIADCYITIWDDYTIHNNPDQKTWTQCRVKENKFVLNLGYIYQQKQDKTVPLYRCQNKTPIDIYAKLATNCDSKSQDEGLYGYLYERADSTATPPPEDTTTPEPTVDINQQDARFILYSNIPDTMKTGEKRTITIIMANTGTVTWTNKDKYAIGNPDNGTLWGPGRIFMPDDAAVAPNALYSFTRTITAPSTPGIYPFEWQMLQTGIRWFGQRTPKKMITVTP